MSNNNDKIPIGKISNVSPDCYHVMINVKKEFRRFKPGDIITLDMIEPYESVAVRKVAEYIKTHLSDAYYFDIKHAKEIVQLVHEAEDADE
jgi:phage anti-repressor protein